MDPSPVVPDAGGAGKLLPWRSARGGCCC